MTKEISPAFIKGITEIANSPRLKCKGNPIKQWMVIRVLIAHQLYLEKLKHEYTSACCHVPVRVEGGENDGNLGGTRFYVCTKCDKPCNTFEVEHGG